MTDEEIAKELLSVLKEKMMYREGLPSDGWVVEMICNALAAASVQAGACYCCRDGGCQPGCRCQEFVGDAD